MQEHSDVPRHSLAMRIEQKVAVVQEVLACHISLTLSFPPHERVQLQPKRGCEEGIAAQLSGCTMMFMMIMITMMMMMMMMVNVVLNVMGVMASIGQHLQGSCCSECDCRSACTFCPS